MQKLTNVPHLNLQQAPHQLLCPTPRQQPANISASRPSTPVTLDISPELNQAHLKDLSKNLSLPFGKKIYLYKPLASVGHSNFLLFITPHPACTRDPSLQKIAQNSYSQIVNEISILNQLNQIAEVQTHLPPIPKIATSYRWAQRLSSDFNPVNFIKKQDLAGDMDLLTYSEKYFSVPFYETEKPIACLIQRIVLLKQYLPALITFHQVGLVHKDIKSENMTLNRPDATSSCFKFIDFGCSRFLTDPRLTDITGSHRTLDLNLHQYESLKTDQAKLAVLSSDIYSFACTSFELIFANVYQDFFNQNNQLLITPYRDYFFYTLHQFSPPLHTTLTNMLSLNWQVRPTANSVLLEFTRIIQDLENIQHNGEQT